MGAAAVTPWLPTDMLQEESDGKADVRWKTCSGSASTGQTTGRTEPFYPVFFERQTLRFLRAGEPPSLRVSTYTRFLFLQENLFLADLKRGSDGHWSLSVGKFNEYVAEGYVSSEELMREDAHPIILCLAKSKPFQMATLW